MVIGSTSSQQSTLSNTLNFQSTISSSTLESFEQQLTEAIEGFLGNSGNGSQIEINIEPGQQAGSLNVDVTADAAPASSNTTTSAVSTAASETTSSSTTTPPAATPASNASPSTSNAATNSESTTTSDATSLTTLTSNPNSYITPADAYWAEQPAAVQALRYAPDDEKAAMAQQFANEGYTIDVPIMVWGWDPLATMIQREEDGYTWVPSALQPNVQSAPGVDMPGVTPYNPNDPPPGSIQVSTAFANGTDIAADPAAEMWLQGQSSTTNGLTVVTS